MAFQILSLSGGGFLGLYTISVLADLEERIGAPIASRFDLIAGTSVGGVIAIGLANEVPAAAIKTAFERQGINIFSDRLPPRTAAGKFLDVMRSAFSPKYKAIALRETIIEIIGADTLIGHLKHPCIIPTVCLTKGGPQVFEQRTMKKVFRHLVPFLMFCYFFNFLDRVNVSFAALDMNRDLGFSASVFGFGSGILFLSYMLCETPSNALLARFGARKWLARIMITWGIIASSMVFVSGEYSFYTIRVFLGAAEAGFFPGIIYYLTLWFPGVYRARVTGLFMACIPLSAAIGSPLSTSLLYLDGILGLRGWQWLFLLEGIPSVLLGVATFFYLTERPSDASRWLEQDERNWLDGRVTAEHDRKQAELSLGMWATLVNPRVLMLSLIAYCLASITLGVGFFLPLIVKGFGLTNMQTGLVAIIPPAFGAAGMIWWGRKSDRAMERKYHLVAAMALAAIGIAAAAFVDNPILKMVCLTFSAIGVYSCSPVFWTLAPNFLTGPSAAVGIAFINSVAALGAFVAPWLIGLIKDATGSYSYGLLMLAALVAGGAVMVLGIEHDIALEHAPEQPVTDLL